MISVNLAGKRPGALLAVGSAIAGIPTCPAVPNPLLSAGHPHLISSTAAAPMNWLSWSGRPLRRSDTGATSARGMMSDDALPLAIGLVVEPGEDLHAPVADAAADAEAARAGAEVAPVAQGRDRDADNVSHFLHGKQFVVGARGAGHSGPLGATHGVPPDGLPVVVRGLSGGCRSFPQGPWTGPCGQ